MSGRIDDALLAKYGKSGPRYTSYPPAPLWHEGVGASDLVRALGTMGARHRVDRRMTVDAADAEIYVHIPFCAQLCTFCGCHTFITKKQEPVEQFLGAIEREADAVAAAAGRKLRIGGLHLGGGTPTHLSIERMTRLLDALEARFDFTPCRERSLEAHPHVTQLEQIDHLAARGFTRLSMGVQDLTPEVQAAIHRFQTHEETARLVAHARMRGFTSVNVDLIYGLPEQSLEGFRTTVEQVIAMRVDRLAVYGYAHVPWLKRHQRSLDEKTLPSPALRRDLYAQARTQLEGAGFREIGFDHFALPTDELFTAQRDGLLTRTFMGFTVRHAPNLIGLGPSAIGEIGRLYAQNESGLGPWLNTIEERGLATRRGFLLTAEDDLRRDVIRALLCHLEVDGAAIGRAHRVEFARHFADELTKLEPMVADGLLEIRDGGERLVLTESGRYLARNVAMVFDQHLAAPSPTAPAGPRYSQTV
jgi:oxygen-independent coproporphyrinogen-3 oxidase